MFTWEIKAEKTTHATPETIWNFWKNVAGWPKWDHDLEWSRLEGEFEKGTKGTLKPKGWFASDFTITELKHHVEHTETTSMPMTKLVFSHRLEQTRDNGVNVVHHLKVSGLLAPLLGITMRFKLKKTVPEALEALVKQAEA